MLIKWNKYGKFLACSAYPECRSTKPLQSPEAAGESCDACGAPMVVKSGRFGRFLACSKYPQCRETRPVPRGNKRLRVPKDWSQTCEKCTSPMKVKYGRRGAFIACTGYPECRNTARVPKEWYVEVKPPEGDGAAGPTAEPPKDWAELCEKCQSRLAVRKGPRGFFIGCTAYPKCRFVKEVPAGWIRTPAPAEPPPGSEAED
jgi:DNA topoisomerase-1